MAAISSQISVFLLFLAWEKYFFNAFRLKKTPTILTKIAFHVFGKYKVLKENTLDSGNI